jgi:hypothetical protein
MPPSITCFQQRTAQLISSRSLRNQGDGIVEIAKQFLRNMDISLFTNGNESMFRSQLNEQTHRLIRRGRNHGKEIKWGSARKVINVFLEECLYSKAINDEYGIQRIIGFLEIPLDSQVFRFLKKVERESIEVLGNPNLPTKFTIKSLKHYNSKRFQQYASIISENIEVVAQSLPEYFIDNNDWHDWKRIHLDLVAWTHDVGN